MKKTDSLMPGMKFGKLTIVRPESGGKWVCHCVCGNTSYPTTHNLLSSKSRSCGHCRKNTYEDCNDGKSVAVTTADGHTFYIDKDDEAIVRQYTWYISKDSNGFETIINRNAAKLHRLIMSPPQGYEVDHIDLDRLNNRRSNLRICTHQQNQMNQPLQSNNTSGVSGVSYYPPRAKYRARIKVNHKDIHLGYFDSFVSAVQARNVGMEFFFGDFGRYNTVPPAPEWLRSEVLIRCNRISCTVGNHTALQNAA